MRDFVAYVLKRHESKATGKDETKVGQMINFEERITWLAVHVSQHLCVIFDWLAREVLTWSLSLSLSSHQRLFLSFSFFLMFFTLGCKSAWECVQKVPSQPLPPDAAARARQHRARHGTCTYLINYSMQQGVRTISPSCYCYCLFVLACDYGCACVLCMYLYVLVCANGCVCL